MTMASEARVSMKSFKLDTPKSLAQRVMLRLREAIIDGEFELGAVISEEMIAQSFGVSRTPVREAMGQLQSQGLVVIRPQVGSTRCKDEAADLRSYHHEALRLQLPHRLSHRRPADAE